MTLTHDMQFLRKTLFDTYRSKAEPIGNRSWRGTRCSLYHGIPVALFEEFRKYYRNSPERKGQRVKYAFRGPRVNAKGDTRYKHQKQSNCLKRFGETFAVYLY